MESLVLCFRWFVNRIERGVFQGFRNGVMGLPAFMGPGRGEQMALVGFAKKPVYNHIFRKTG
jgi:hypothetical protein